jgi:S1-C subfamily serine protease
MHAPDTKANWGLIALITSVIIVLVAIVGLFHARIAGMTGHVFGAPKVPVKVASSAPPVSLGEFKNGFASVIDPDLPAVVNISSTKVVKRQNTMPQFFNDPTFSAVLRRPVRTYKPRATGAKRVQPRIGRHCE